MPAVLTGSGQQDATNPILNPSVRVQAKVGVRVYAPDDPRFGSMNEQFSENTLPVQIVRTIPAVAAPAPILQRPVILGASPQPASAGDVIRLEGLRVGADRFGRDKGPLPRIVFSKDSTSITAKLNGGSRFDNRPDGPQAVAVVVPAGIEAGNWNVVVELDGLEAAPFPVSIAEWIPPQIDRLYPERVNPGGAVTVWGAHFRTNDGIEMTDALGASHTSGSGTFGDSVAFLVPTDAPEGEASVRIRASRNGATVYSRALSFLVTFAPLPLDLSGSTARSVGAGQWLDFEGTTLDGPIHWSDRTEVEFRQRSEVVVTQTARPTALRVQVPAIMLPGPITLRGRTWHEGAVSEWSAPAAFLVAGRAVAPTIRGVVVGPGQQYVSLIGRATPQRVEAADGDHVVLNGFFPTSDTTRIPIVLERRGRSVRVTSKRLDAYNVDLLVPEGLSGGPWTITVGATEGMPPLSLPISMYAHIPTSGRRSN